MAAEIAVQQLLGVGRTLAAEGLPLTELLGDADIDEVDLGNPARRLDWQHYAAVLDCVAAWRSSDWLFQRGAESILEPTAQLFRTGLLIAFDDPAAALEWMVAPYGPFSAVTPCIGSELRPAGHRRHLLRTIMVDGLAPCRAHHAFVRGVLSAAPCVLFERAARVNAEPTVDGADYHIEFAPPRLIAGVRRAFARRRPRPDYLREVGITYLAVIEQQRALQEEVTRRLSAEAEVAQRDRVESLGQIAASVAHDFNNVLTVAMSQIDEIRHSPPEELQRHADDAMQSLELAAALPRRLLSYAARQPMPGGRLSVNDALAALKPMLESTVGSGCEVTMVLDAGAPPVALDRDQFENAILNLVVNSRDAMGGSGRVTITSSCIDHLPDASRTTSDGAGVYVRVRVRDEGSGFTSVALRRGFDPYFSTKPVGQGTGLGLSSVWGLVKQAGGHASLANHPAGGAVIDLYLRAADDSASTSQAHLDEAQESC